MLFPRLRRIFGFEQHLAQRHQLKRRFQPHLEPLEDRVLPSAADLQLTQHARGSALPASEMTYTLRVVNLGPDTAHGISVNDSLPQGVTFLSQSQTAGPAFSLTNAGNQVSDSIDALAAGAVATLLVTVRLDANLTDGTVLTNTATVSSDTADLFLNNNAQAVSTTVYTYSGAALPAVVVTNPGAQFASEGAAVGLQIHATASGGGALTYGAVGLPGGLRIDASTGLISGTISSGAAADSPFATTVSVTDGTHGSSQTFRWDVAAGAGGSITVTNPGPQFSNEQEQVTLQVRAASAVGLALTFSASGLPAGLTIDPSTGLISGTIGSDAAASGPYQVTVSVGGGSASTTQSFVWVVAASRLVTVLAPGDQRGAVGDQVSLQVSASDSAEGALTFSASGLPAGLSIGASTGLISGTIGSGAAANGPYQVTVTASDGAHGDAVSFAWAVAGSVTLTNPGGLDNSEGDSVSLQAEATDSAEAAISYSASGLPAGLSINASTGVISGTISAGTAANGPFHTTITASDGNSYDSQSFLWRVGCPVTLTPIDDQTSAPGDQVTLQVEGGDAAGGPLSYSASGLPAGLGLDPDSGLIAGTVTLAAAVGGGAHEVTVTATDGTFSATWAFSWYVTGPVAVTDPGDQSGTEGDMVTLQVQASDAVAGTLTYSAASLPPGLSIDASSGLISGTISTGAAAQGPFTTTVTASDGTYSDTKTFEWAVGAPLFLPPEPVTVTRPGDQNSVEGATVTLQVWASDSSSGTLTYGAGGLPAGLSIDARTGLISGTISAGAATGRPYHVTVTASDGTFGDVQDFWWGVTGPVTVTSPGDQNGAEGSHALLQVQAASSVGGTLTYSASGLPAGLSISASTGLISGTISAGAATDPDYQVTVIVSNGTSAGGRSFAWHVVSAVTMSGLADRSSAEGDAVTLQVQASGPMGGMLTYGATNLPGGVSISASTGLISGTIGGGAAASGPYYVTVTASDGTYSNRESFLWTVVVPTPPANPVAVLSPGDRMNAEGDQVSVLVPASDTSGGTLVYSAVGLPAGLMINMMTGVISGTISAGAAANGPYQVTVTASDGLSHDSRSFSWDIFGPVALSTPGDQGNAEGDEVSLQLQATSATGATLSYSVTGLPTGLTLNGGTGVISGTLSAGAATNGPYQVTVTATAGASGARVSFSWDVSGPITLSNPGNQSGTEGEQVALQIRAADSAAAALTYSATGLPGGLTIDAGTGLIAGVISNTAALGGPYHVTVTVTDGTSGARQSFEWAVAHPGPVRLTSPGNQAGAEGNGVILRLQASDSSGGHLSYGAVGLPPGLSLDPTTGLISGTISAGAAAGAPYSVTLTATDGTYASSQSFRWAVTTPGAVRLTSPGDQQSAEGDGIALKLAASDTAGGALTFSATGLPAGVAIDQHTGLISGKINSGDAASQPYTVTVTASDGAADDRQSFTWAVTAPGPVTVTRIDDQSGAEGDAVALQLQASDALGAPLSYDATGLPDGLSIDPSTGLITGTLPAGAAANGPYQVTVTASDGPAQDSQSFQWVVTAAGPVTLTGPGDQQNAEGDSVTLQMVASSSAGGTITYGASGLPSGLAIDQHTGLISGTLHGGSAANRPYVVTVTASDGTNSDRQAFQWTVGAANPDAAGPATLSDPEAAVGSGVNPGPGILAASDLIDVTVAPLGAPPPSGSSPGPLGGGSPGSSGGSGGNTGSSQPSTQITEAYFTRHYTELASGREGIRNVDVAITASFDGSPTAVAGSLSGSITTTVWGVTAGGYTYGPVTVTTDYAMPLPGGAGRPSLGVVPGSIFEYEDYATAGWDHVHWSDGATFSDQGTLTDGGGAVYQFFNDAGTTAWRDTTHTGGPPEGAINWSGTETTASTFGDAYRYEAGVSDKKENFPIDTEYGEDGYPTDLFNDPVGGTKYLSRSYQEGSSGGNGKDTNVWTDGEVTQVITGTHTTSGGNDGYRYYVADRTETVKGDPNGANSRDTDTFAWNVDYQRRGDYGSGYDADLSGPNRLGLIGTVKTREDNSGTVLRNRFNVKDGYHREDGTDKRDGTLTVSVTDNGRPSTYSNFETHSRTTSAFGTPVFSGGTLSFVSADSGRYDYTRKGSVKVTTTDSGTYTQKVWPVVGRPVGTTTGTLYSSTRDTVSADVHHKGEVDAINHTSSIDNTDDVSGSNWSLTRVKGLYVANSGGGTVDADSFSLAWGDSSTDSRVNLSSDDDSGLPPDGGSYLHTKSSQTQTGWDWSKAVAPGAPTTITLILSYSSSSADETTDFSLSQQGKLNGPWEGTWKSTTVVDMTTTTRGSGTLKDGSTTANDTAHSTASTTSKTTVDLYLGDGKPTGTSGSTDTNTIAYSYKLDDTVKKDNGVLDAKTGSNASGRNSTTDTRDLTWNSGAASGTRTFTVKQQGGGTSSIKAEGKPSDEHGHTGKWDLKSSTTTTIDDTVTTKFAPTEADWRVTGLRFDTADTTKVKAAFDESDNGLGRDEDPPQWDSRHPNEHAVHIKDEHSTREERHGTPARYWFVSELTQDLENVSTDSGSGEWHAGGSRFRQSHSSYSWWSVNGHNNQQGWRNADGGESKTVDVDMTRKQLSEKYLTVIGSGWFETKRLHAVTVHTVQRSTPAGGVRGTRTTTTEDVTWEKVFNVQTGVLIDHTGDLRNVGGDVALYIDDPRVKTTEEDIGWGAGLQDKPLPAALLWEDLTTDPGMRAVAARAGDVLRIVGGVVDVVSGAIITLTSCGLGIIPGVGLMAVGVDQILTGATNLASGKESMSVFEFGGYSGALALGASEQGAQFAGAMTPAVLSALFNFAGALSRSCFAAGTPLLTPEGSKAIEQFRPGDLILARDEYNAEGLVEAKVVEEVFVATGRILHVHVGGRVIRTTPEHPFFVEGKGWTAAGELRVGDLLSSHDGRWVAVEDLLDTGEYETVHNLRVADHHTYFVGANEWGFSAWAHNQCNHYGLADPATTADGERFVQRAQYWQRQIPKEHRGGVVVAVTEVDGREIVTLYANAGNTGDLVPQRVINAFRNQVREAGSLFDRASGAWHAEQVAFNNNPGLRAIGISRRAGPCDVCDLFFDQSEWYNLYWPMR
jgi:uncharacterized repeat protein (TIGR01451 family)